MAINNNGDALAFASEELKNNKEIVLSAANCDYCTTIALSNASKGLQEDSNFVLQIVKLDGLSLLFASSDLRENREIVIAAVQQNQNVFEYIQPTFQNDPDVLELLKEQD